MIPRLKPATEITTWSVFMPRINPWVLSAFCKSAQLDPKETTLKLSSTRVLAMALPTDPLIRIVTLALITFKSKAKVRYVAEASDIHFSLQQ